MGTGPSPLAARLVSKPRSTTPPSLDTSLVSRSISFRSADNSDAVPGRGGVGGCVVGC